MGFKLTSNIFTLPEDSYSAINSLGINKSSAASLKQKTPRGTIAGKDRRKSQQLGRRPLSEDPFPSCDYSVSTIPVRFSNRPDSTPKQQLTVNTSNRIIKYVNTSTHRTRSACKLAIINAQSVCNKTEEISDFIIHESLDFALITETWLNINNAHCELQMTPSGYTLKHVDRPGKRGGGVAITHESTYRSSIIKTADYSGFESICYDFKLPNTVLRLACIYRPGQASVTFFAQFASFLEDTTLGSETIIIAGDFNIHVDNPHCASTKKVNRCFR